MLYDLLTGHLQVTSLPPQTIVEFQPRVWSDAWAKGLRPCPARVIAESLVFLSCEHHFIREFAMGVPAIAVVRLSWGVAFNHRKTMGKPSENPIK